MVARVQPASWVDGMAQQRMGPTDLSGLDKRSGSGTSGSVACSWDVKRTGERADDSGSTGQDHPGSRGQDGVALAACSSVAWGLGPLSLRSSAAAQVPGTLERRAEAAVVTGHAYTRRESPGTWDLGPGRLAGPFSSTASGPRLPARCSCLGRGYAGSYILRPYLCLGTSSRSSAKQCTENGAFPG